VCARVANPDLWQAPDRSQVPPVSSRYFARSFNNASIRDSRMQCKFPPVRVYSPLLNDFPRIDCKNELDATLSTTTGRMRYAAITDTSSMPIASLRIRLCRLRCVGGAEDVALSEGRGRPASPHTRMADRIADSWFAVHPVCQRLRLRRQDDLACASYR